MSAKSDKFRKVRLDQSPYLFHFIKGNSVAAEATLMTILSEQRLISKVKDYICFTASPITQVGDFFETKVNKTGEPMYQPYGIGFSRDILIKEYNAQNVIYGKKEEKDLFEKFGMGWRFLELDVENFDFEYLREWRIHTNCFDFSMFPKEHMIVIAPTNDKLLDFVTKEYYVECWDYDEGTGEAFKDLTEMYERSWKGTSLEEIRARKFISDYEVSGSTVTQEIGQDMFDSVAEKMSRKTKELNEMIAKQLRGFFGNASEK